MGISLFVPKIFSLQFALQRADKAELSSWSGLSGQSVILDINPEQWKVGEGISFNPALPSDTETNWAQHPQFLLQKTLKILHNNLQIINLCFLKCYIRAVKHQCDRALLECLLHEHLLHNLHRQLQHLSEFPKSQSPLQSYERVSRWALSVHTVSLYVTDVSGATVGIEREGLQAICPGSRFEKGW